MQAEELKTWGNQRKPESPPTSPYARAQRAWDDRLGQVVVQAKNWRLAALGQSVIILALIGVIGVQASKRTVEPAIIQVADTGKAVYVGKATQQVYAPGTNEIRYFLNDFLQRVRSVPLDPIVLRQNWLTAYSFMRQGAANKLDQWVQTLGDQAPNAIIGKQTITVQPISVIPLNESTYEVRWEETVYGIQGQVEAVDTYTGSFVVELEEPKTEAQIQKNPLGLFIRDFSWHEDLKGS